MKDMIFDDFQNCVSESLLRHKSILDIITKLDESQARVNRALIKSFTNCGCIEINGKKQCIPDETQTIEELNNCLKSHLNGELCDNCRDIISTELGNHLFYIASLCNALDLNLYDILINEYDKLNTLGKYRLR